MSLIGCNLFQDDLEIDLDLRRGQLDLNLQWFPVTVFLWYVSTKGHFTHEPRAVTLCNGEVPWLSSKDRSMGVGKAVLCSHEPSSIVWSENGPRCRTISYFVGGKEGRIWFYIICFKLYQLKKITWWCLSVLESALQDVLKSILLKRNILKKVMVSQNLHHAHLLETNSDRPCTLIHNLPCRTPCTLFIHKIFFGPLGLHLLGWSELGRSLPFRPMRALTLPWSGAFNLVCEVAPTFG